MCLQRLFRNAKYKLEQGWRSRERSKIAEGSSVDRMKDESYHTNASDFRGDTDKHKISIRHSAKEKTKQFTVEAKNKSSLSLFAWKGVKRL